MRFAIYYPLHFIGIFLLFLAIGGMCISCRNGLSKEENPSRKFLAITHGVALLIIIIGGMGLMKATGAMIPNEDGSTSMPAWIILKMVLWLVFGCSSIIIYKQPKLASVFLFFFMALGTFAGLTAKFKSWTAFSSFFSSPAVEEPAEQPTETEDSSEKSEATDAK